MMSQMRSKPLITVKEGNDQTSFTVFFNTIKQKNDKILSVYPQMGNHTTTYTK